VCSGRFARSCRYARASDRRDRAPRDLRSNRRVYKRHDRGVRTGGNHGRTGGRDGNRRHNHLGLVDGDPSTNIADIERVETVFKNGTGYDSKKIFESVKGFVGRI